MVAGAGLEPATFGLCVPLQFSLPEHQFVVWTFSLPSAELLGHLPLSLYTFDHNEMVAWLGITTARGFPEFER